MRDFSFIYLFKTVSRGVYLEAMDSFNRSHISGGLLCLFVTTFCRQHSNRNESNTNFPLKYCVFLAGIQLLRGLLSWILAKLFQLNWTFPSRLHVQSQHGITNRRTCSVFVSFNWQFVVFNLWQHKVWLSPILSSDTWCVHDMSCGGSGKTRF